MEQEDSVDSEPLGVDVEEVFRLSTFRISLSLSVSFLLLIVIPDLCYPLSVSKYSEQTSGSGHQVTVILFGIGMISDVLIYFLMGTSVKKMLATKLWMVAGIGSDPEYFL